MNKYNLKYGTIFGVSSGIFMLFAFYSGLPTRGDRIFMLANILFMYAPSFFTIYLTRKNNNNEISFKHAIKYGISSALLSSFIFTAFTAFYYFVLNPDFANVYIKDIEISLKQMGVKGEQLNKEMSAWKKDMSPMNQSFKVFIGTTLFSSLLAGVNALIFCKKD